MLQVSHSDRQAVSLTPRVARPAIQAGNPALRAAAPAIQARRSGCRVLHPAVRVRHSTSQGLIPAYFVVDTMVPSIPFAVNWNVTRSPT